MANIKCFEDLKIWQEARNLTILIYKISTLENFCNDFRFCGQIRAAAGSIMDNIAEGYERNGNKEFIHFLVIAKGSCGEVRSQLYRACDLHYIDETKRKELHEKCLGLSAAIASLINYLRKSNVTGIKYKTSTPENS